MLDARPLFIEFVGLPGAGKTTVSRRIEDELTQRGYACARRLPVLGEELGAVERAARRTATLMREWRRTSAAFTYLLTSRTLSRAGLQWTLRLPTWPLKWRLAREAGIDVVVLDAGLVQNAWAVTIGGRFGDGAAASALLRNLLAGERPRYAFVHFEIDVEGSLQRIGQRANLSWRFDGMDPERARRFLGTHQPHMTHLLDQAATLTQAPVCRIDAHRPVEESCQRILEFVEGLMRT